MSSGRDIVALLTASHALPTPPLRSVHLSIIVEGICSAWEEVLRNFPTIATQDPESVVNGALVSHLKLSTRGRSPFASLVQEVDRGTEQYNYDGTRHELRPDLQFRLKRLNSGYPLVGECKIMDVRGRKGLDKYKANGIERFMTGDYAWANSEGLMVAYVRDSSDAHGCLTEVTGSAPEPWKALARTHYRTRHPRAFEYVDRDPTLEVPGDIALVHVWLSGAKEAMFPPPELAAQI